MSEVTVGTRKECCKEPANLVVQPQDPQRPDLTVHVCSVCNCRHFRAKLSAGTSNIIEVLLAIQGSLKDLRNQNADFSERLLALENKAQLQEG